MTVETRASWNARPSRGITPLRSTKGVKAHYTGGFVDDRTLTDHGSCHAYVRSFQNQHMDGHGWNDLGYSMVACNHAAMIGRGPHVLPAANGPGLNSGHYAILLLVGTGGVTRPTDAMLLRFHEARTYLMNQGDAGTQIKGHRDGYATDCPGDPIYDWVRLGAPKPGHAPIPPPPLPEENYPPMEIASFKLDSPVVVNRGQWFDVPWDTEISDPTDVHSASGTSVLFGFPCVYAGVEFSAVLKGLPAGTVVDTRLAEFKYQRGATPVDTLEQIGQLQTRSADDRGFVHHVGSGILEEGRKLRCQIFVPDGPETITITSAQVNAPFTR